MNLETALKEAARKARRQDAADTLASLDRLSRQRALTEAESRRLASAIAQVDRPGEKQRHFWTEAMDSQLVDMRRRGLSAPTIASAMSVSLKAVEMRVWRLRRNGALHGD